MKYELRESSLLLTALLGSAIGIAGFACNSSPTDASGSGGTGASGGGGSGGTSTAAPPTLSCLQVLQCIVDCPDPDGPCPDECNARGSSDTQDMVIALATCIETNQCSDATCVQDACSAELSTCIDGSAPANTGTPLQGSGPPGSVPGDLVGTWSGARDGDTGTLTLNADGTGSWQIARTSQNYACLSVKGLIKSGTIVVEPTIMTLYATSVVSYEQTCMPPPSETPMEPVTEVLQWHPHESDPNVIFVVDTACANQYPEAQKPGGCEYAGCPIGLYCTTRLERQ